MANGRGVFRRQQAQGQATTACPGEEVAKVAYELFEQRGRTDGQDLDDWLKAEAIVRQRRSSRASF